MTRGYFEIGVYHPKNELNIGTLWRSALQLGAAGIFTVGRRYRHQSSDTTKAPLHIPMRHYLCLDEMLASRPSGSILVGVEMGGRTLETYCHPLRATYLLGAEDHGLPESVLDMCNSIVSLSASGPASFNVAVAGSIVMYHRQFISKVA